MVTLSDFYDDLEDAGAGKPQYETLGDALDRYNASLAHTPLKGKDTFVIASSIVAVAPFPSSQSIGAIVECYIE